MRRAANLLAARGDQYDMSSLRQRLRSPLLAVIAVNSRFSASAGKIAIARPFAILAPLFKVRQECNRFADQESSRGDFVHLGVRPCPRGRSKALLKDVAGPSDNLVKRQC
jgi:hypothetical protein